MRCGRFLRSSVLAAASLGFSANAAVLAQDQQEVVNQGFWVESATVHAGEVKAGEVGVAVFVFHNDTAEDVKIVSAVPT